MLVYDQLIPVFNEDSQLSLLVDFDSGVERLIIHNENAGDIWGVDDIRYTV